jgi:hypothetical protein
VHPSVNFWYPTLNFQHPAKNRTTALASRVAPGPRWKARRVNASNGSAAKTRSSSTGSDYPIAGVVQIQADRVKALFSL